MGKKGAQALEKNPNWKGGRTVTEHGYVLVKRPNHPMADCRGYVYEHRLIGESLMGRPLESREEVHHDDRNRSRNEPDNLIVEGSHADHMLHHRKRDDLRIPGEPNPVISCACGCGEQFSKYDATNRPRVYVSGHNPQPAPARQSTLSLLMERPRLGRELARLLGCSPGAMRTLLSHLKKSGLAQKQDDGLWRVMERRNGR